VTPLQLAHYASIIATRQDLETTPVAAYRDPRSGRSVASGGVRGEVTGIAAEDWRRVSTA